MENNECGKCGYCCKMIWLPYSKKYIKDILKKNPNHCDAKFILENWERVSKEKGKKLNPSYFKKTLKRKSFFYTCKKYDSKNKICTVHKDRPDVCRNFPLYSKYKEINGIKKLDPGYVLYSKNCIFNKIIATKKEWKQ